MGEPLQFPRIFLSKDIETDCGALGSQLLDVRYERIGGGISVTAVFLNNHDYFDEISKYSSHKIDELAAEIYSEEPDGCSLDKARAEGEG